MAQGRMDCCCGKSVQRNVNALGLLYKIISKRGSSEPVDAPDEEILIGEHHVDKTLKTKPMLLRNCMEFYHTAMLLREGIQEFQLAKNSFLTHNYVSTQL